MVSPRLTIALFSNVNHSPSATGSIYKSLAKVVVSSMVSVYLPIQPLAASSVKSFTSWFNPNVTAVPMPPANICKA